MALVLVPLALAPLAERLVLLALAPALALALELAPALVLESVRELALDLLLERLCPELFPGQLLVFPLDFVVFDRPLKISPPLKNNS